MTQRRPISATLLRLALLLVFALAALPGGPQVNVAHAAGGNILTLSVISADDSATYGIAKGDPITNFKYIINVDNTGTTTQRTPAQGGGCSPADAGYPDTCKWVSVAGRANNSPIYTQGDQSD